MANDRAPLCTTNPFFGVDEAAAVENMEGLIEIAVQANLAYLAANPETPRLYESHVVYRDAQPRYIPTIPEILEDGFAACGGLAAWRTAELRHLGIDPYARVRLQRQSNDPKSRNYHALIARGDRMRRGPTRGGGWEDPSAAVIARAMHRRKSAGKPGRGRRY